MTLLRIALLSLPLSLACGDKDGDDTSTGDGGADGGGTDGGGDGGTDGGTDGGGDGGTDGGTEEMGFTLTGTVVDLSTRSPGGEGLCIHALDPTSVLGGDTELDIVASAVVGTGGAYTLENVVMPSLLGMFVLVADCADEGTVWTTATGIPTSDYEDLGEGDTLTQTALLVSTTFKMGMEASMAATGSTHDLATEGAIIAFVQDAAGNPVGGATVTCEDCPLTWYMDADPSDGLFTTGPSLNTTTVQAAGSLVVIPAAPLDSYETAIADSSYTWDNQTFGSLPGLAVIGAFNANP